MLRWVNYVHTIIRSPLIVQVLQGFLAFVSVLVFCLLGGIVLAVLEEQAEKDVLADEADFFRRVRDAVPEKILDELVERGKVLVPDSVNGSTYSDRHWDLSSEGGIARIFLFAFTLGSTVGYGNVPLRTEAGKTFAAFFSLLLIPAVMVAYTYLAMRLLAVAEFLIASFSPRNWQEFAKFDQDRSGQISLQEMRLALQALGETEVNDAELGKMMADIDKDGEADTLNYAEFCRLLHLLSPPEVARRRHRARLIATVIMTFLWLLFGSAMLVKFEGWHFRTAMWFCWITVSTIGLGDYVPSTSHGATFLVMWATLGLGLAALVVTEMADGIMRTYGSTAKAACDAAGVVSGGDEGEPAEDDESERRRRAGPNKEEDESNPPVPDESVGATSVEISIGQRMSSVVTATQQRSPTF